MVTRSSAILLLLLLLPWRWSAAIEDIPVQLPLPGLLFPNDDVLAGVEHLALGPLQSERPDFIGSIPVPFYFDRFQLYRLDAHIHGPLPERLDRLLTTDDLAVGWQHLPVVRIDGRCASCIAATEGGHKLCDWRRNGSADLGCGRLRHGAFPPCLVFPAT